MDSPLAASSRLRCQSLVVSWGRSVSQSPSCHNKPPEDRQEKHSSAYIVEIVSWICNIRDLPPAPSEGRKICGFNVVLDPDDHRSSHFCLTVSNASAGILADIDDHVSSSSSGIQSKKVSKLLPYPGVHSKHLLPF